MRQYREEAGMHVKKINSRGELSVANTEKKSKISRTGHSEKKQLYKITIASVRSGYKRVIHVSKAHVWAVFAIGAVLIIGFFSGVVVAGTSRHQITEKNEQLETAHASFSKVSTDLDGLARSFSEFQHLLNDILATKHYNYDDPTILDIADNRVGDLSSVYTLSADAVEHPLSAHGIDDQSIVSFTRLIHASREPLAEIKDVLESQRDLFTDVPNIWPLANEHGSVTMEFGPNRHPISNAWYLHKGIDIAGAYGVTVVASASGKVIEAGYDFTAGYGNYVLVRHKYGFRTRYSHLGAIYVRKGEDVVQGQSLGTLGSTGISSGPHLDFQIILGTDVVDPSLFLKISRDDFARASKDR